MTPAKQGATQSDRRAGKRPDSLTAPERMGEADEARVPGGSHNPDHS